MQLNQNDYEPLRWAVVLLVLTILLGACDRGPGKQAAPVPEVATVTIEPQQVELSTELPGRTTAYLVAEIRPQVNGIIQKRLFQEGSDVKAGQLLYQIDPAPFQVAHDSAKASLGKAQANLPSIRLRAERYQELLADKAVSRQDYDDAAAAVAQARAEIEYWQAAVEGARINLGYTRVTAPISGRIGKSSVTVGALVTAYQPTSLSTIQQLDPIYVDVTQSSAELAAFETQPGNRPAQRRWSQREESPPPPGGRHPVSPGRHPAIPRRHGGPGDRVFHLAYRGPESETSAPAGHVRAGRGPGGYRGTGHPGSSTRGEPQSQGRTRRPGRG